MSRNKFRTINAGSEVVVVGQIQDEVTELTPQVSGFCGNDDGVGKVETTYPLDLYIHYNIPILVRFWDSWGVLEKDKTYRVEWMKILLTSIRTSSTSRKPLS